MSADWLLVEYGTKSEPNSWPTEALLVSGDASLADIRELVRHLVPAGEKIDFRVSDLLSEVTMFAIEEVRHIQCGRIFNLVAPDWTSREERSKRSLRYRQFAPRTDPSEYAVGKREVPASARVKPPENPVDMAEARILNLLTYLTEELEHMDVDSEWPFWIEKARQKDADGCAASMFTGDTWDKNLRDALAGLLVEIFRNV